MKKTIFVLLLVLTLGNALPTSAQCVYWGYTGTSANLWGWMVNSAAATLIGMVTRFGCSEYRLSIWEMKEYGIPVEMEFNDAKRLYGFKKMYANSTWGAMVGVDLAGSILSPFVSCHYQLTNFGSKFSDDEDFTENKIQSVFPAIGMRILPFRQLYRNHYWAPFVELGYAYDYYTKCKTFYSDDIKQLENGSNSTYGIGVKVKQTAYLLNMNIYHHNLFDQKYIAADGVSKPFAGTESKQLFVGFTITKRYLKYENI